LPTNFFIALVTWLEGKWRKKRRHEKRPKNKGEKHEGKKRKPDARDAVHNVPAPESSLQILASDHGLKKRALKKAATRAVFFANPLL
jgi:L-aminopeptidase/D-esterase-like protein